MTTNHISTMAPLGFPVMFEIWLRRSHLISSSLMGFRGTWVGNESMSQWGKSMWDLWASNFSICTKLFRLKCIFKERNNALLSWCVFYEQICLLSMGTISAGHFESYRPVWYFELSSHGTASLYESSLHAWLGSRDSLGAITYRLYNNLQWLNEHNGLVPSWSIQWTGSHAGTGRTVRTLSQRPPGYTHFDVPGVIVHVKVIKKKGVQVKNDDACSVVMKVNTTVGARVDGWMERRVNHGPCSLHPSLPFIRNVFILGWITWLTRCHETPRSAATGPFNSINHRNKEM